ncbi:hypothetical protein MJO28_004050 [Puccinia striiformis f. sp. tritici]|uniref:Uncharacterized protein n=3 Tax=Puccinia striiformis TaxID=27350 RepID=A0A2S4WGB0_9BASI|nr:hypothetical protein MJO28_004050 [Puccinia striiformis f. sp. tritici]KAI7967124.1 hypothetical protein MJO29_000401 [Puccinia striiformis f. sp. tritici]POW20782.1 hypothetical protein PSHT_03226 [Puccinia striiformis]
MFAPTSHTENKKSDPNDPKWQGVDLRTFIYSRKPGQITSAPPSFTSTRTTLRSAQTGDQQTEKSRTSASQLRPSSQHWTSPETSRNSCLKTGVDPQALLVQSSSYEINMTKPKQPASNFPETPLKTRLSKTAKCSQNDATSISLPPTKPLTAYSTAEKSVGKSQPTKRHQSVHFENSNQFVCAKETRKKTAALSKVHSKPQPAPEPPQNHQKDPQSSLKPGSSLSRTKQPPHSASSHRSIPSQKPSSVVSEIVVIFRRMQSGEIGDRETPDS